MNYRREIDGLRAVAVLPVILFHAGFPLFGGGFVGVDVFFVISGFLITGIIVEEMRHGRFSLLNFYERRARRILPALFLVMAASLPAAWMLLSPKDLQDFAQSLVAIGLFASNFLFWQESGYFDAEAELKPMLHTWSLAVEEQYYVIFPLMILVCWRLGPARLFALLATLAAASLALSQWQVQTQPITAFFLLPSRAWQLLLGAMVAFAFAYRVSRADLVGRNLIAAEALGALGLAMILWPVFAYDDRTPFPGLNALAPSVGTALVLAFSAPQTVVGRLLGLPAFVGVGLISYSAYLWHQPLFAFTRHATLGEVSPLVMAALSALALGLAWLSWRFVERPFRARGVVGRRAVLAFAMSGVAAFGAVGLVGHLRSDQITGIRLAGVDPALRESFRTKDQLVDSRSELLRPFKAAADTPFGADPATRRVLILGDSVANDLYGAAMINAALFDGVEFRRLPLDDLCMPQFERVLRGDVSGPRDTGDANRDCLDEALRLRDSAQFAEADVLVLSAFWRRRSTVTPHLGALRLAETLAGQGRRVKLVGLVEMKDASSAAFVALREGMDARQANGFAWRTLRRAAIDPANEDARALAERLPGVDYVDKLALFCDPVTESCLLFGDDGQLMFSDSHHISGPGAVWLGQRLAETGWLNDPGVGGARKAAAD